MALWKKEDSALGAPKWLQAEEGAAPHVGMVENADAVFPNDIDDAVFVDTTEAANATNRAKGLRTPGWHVFDTYTDANGNTRNKSECLVAMGDTTGAGDNDTLAPAPVITFTDQSTGAEVIEDTDDAIFAVDAAVTQGATLTYQWQWVDSASVGADPLVWNNVTFGEGATTDTLNAGTFGIGDNGAKFRVIVSATGAEDAISDTMTLTVNAAA